MTTHVAQIASQYEWVLVAFFSGESGLWGVRNVRREVVYEADLTEWQARLLADTEHADFEDFMAKLPRMGVLAEWERQDQIAKNAIENAGLAGEGTGS